MTDTTEISGANKIMVKTEVSNGNVMEQKTNSSEPLKITIVGDDTIGKTSMLITYTLKKCPEGYLMDTTIFDTFPCTIKVDDVQYEVTLWDTPGVQSYDVLKPKLYETTACFLLCYSVNNRASYDNIILRWYPELKHQYRSVPIILVGTKSDLRGTKYECVTRKMAKKMKKKISACKAMECSAQENIGLNELFIEAVRCAVKGSNKKKRHCTVQ